MPWLPSAPDDLGAADRTRHPTLRAIPNPWNKYIYISTVVTKKILTCYRYANSIQIYVCMAPLDTAQRPMDVSSKQARQFSPQNTSFDPNIRSSGRNSMPGGEIVHEGESSTGYGIDLTSLKSAILYLYVSKNCFSIRWASMPSSP